MTHPSTAGTTGTAGVDASSRLCSLTGIPPPR